jgi:hypothetical protein
LAGAFWQLAQDPVGNATLGNRLIYASGACSFVTCILGWYLFMSIMMASLDFPFSLPGKLALSFLSVLSLGGNLGRLGWGRLTFDFFSCSVRPLETFPRRVGT